MGHKPVANGCWLLRRDGHVKQLYNLFGDGQGGWSVGYEVSRNYNRAGAVTSQTYPSGHTVSYTYDLAGRTRSFTGYLGDGTLRTYARDSRGQGTQPRSGWQGKAAGRGR